MAGFVLKRWIILAVLSAISMMCHAADSVSTEIKPWPAAPFKLLTSGAETLTASTHNEPLLIGRQPGGEPRYFKGELAGILLYNRALSENEQKSATHWLF